MLVQDGRFSAFHPWCVWLIVSPPWNRTSQFWGCYPDFGGSTLIQIFTSSKLVGLKVRNRTASDVSTVAIAFPAYTGLLNRLFDLIDWLKYQHFDDVCYRLRWMYGCHSREEVLACAWCASNHASEFVFGHHILDEVLV
jgi:hypothetical protein